MTSLIIASLLASCAKIEQNLQYIGRFQEFLKASVSADELVARMKNAFPGFRMERFLRVGAQAHYDTHK